MLRTEVKNQEYKDQALWGTRARVTAVPSLEQGRLSDNRMMPTQLKGGKAVHHCTFGDQVLQNEGESSRQAGAENSLPAEPHLVDSQEPTLSPGPVPRVRVPGSLPRSSW